MRKELEKIKNVRASFKGEFGCMGFKSGYRGDLPTVLLKNIQDENGNVLTDHLWFNFTKGFEKLELKEGTVVAFDARVKRYVKGYFGRREDVYVPIEEDYKLSHPTKLRLAS